MPRRWLLESRPLREEPPAFLCAMCTVLRGRDVRDLDAGQKLTMAALAMRILAPLLLEGDDFGCPILGDDFRRYGGARKERRSRLAAGHQYFGEGDGRACFAGKTIDFQHVA